MFADRVRRMLRWLPSHACVVWPTIIRPARKGAYDGLNRVLRNAASNDSRLTADRRGTGWSSKGTVTLRDGLHPDEDGYRFRAWVTAAAVHRCDGDEPPV